MGDFPTFFGTLLGLTIVVAFRAAVFVSMVYLSLIALNYLGVAV
jgi:hypothetical protein